MAKTSVKETTENSPVIYHGDRIVPLLADFISNAADSSTSELEICCSFIKEISNISQVSTLAHTQ